MKNERPPAMKQPTLFQVLLVTASANVISGSLDDVTVRTTHGEVRGLVTSVQGRQVKVYWGIPYAQIPARFQRPQEAEGWEGVLEATSPPPSCHEVPWTGDLPLIPPPSTLPEEDCLRLNLWVPQGCSRADQAEQGGLAVMVWIHGGALQWGSSTVPTYQGQVLAATQCVLVASMNYRLGALGFLSLGTDLAPGNVGLLDQALALQWIHQNAARFGGSPHRITLFGESAGGASTGAHMASPVSRHLFSRAIIQSGPPTAPFGKTTIAKNAATARKLAGVMGCPADDDDENAMIACLSTVDAIKMGEVLSDSESFPFPAFGVVVDDYFLKGPLTESYLSNDFKKVDVMIGVTANDGSFILPGFKGEKLSQTSRPRMDRAAFESTLKNVVFPPMPHPRRHDELLSKVLEYVYVNSSLPGERDDYHSALEKMLSDLNFVCPMYSTVGPLLGLHGVYMYSFDHGSSASPFPRWMGVVHASEIDFVFGRPLDRDHGHPFSQQERQLSTTIMKAWANFAKTGNPNSDDKPDQWPPLNNATYPYAIFRSPGDVIIDRGLRHRECVFWNEVYPQLVDDNTGGPAPNNHDEL